MSVPSLEADLRAAREAAGVSIDQIQQETRIPTDVVQRFESGKLLEDPAFNDVYLKAFLRAYAGAVGLSANRVLAAYDASRAGTYRGELNPEAPAPEEIAPPPPAAEPPPPAAAATPAVAPTAHEPEAPAPPEKAPAVAALSRAPEPAPRPLAAPNEHFPKRRVASAAVASAPRSIDRSWGTIIGATVVVVLVVAGVLWLLFRDDTPRPEAEPVAAADTTQAADTTRADTTAATPAATAGPPLASPIRVTVVAGGNGLQEFRATEIPRDRRPYWVEVGDELVLESAEGVILWGEGARGLNPAEVTLRFQGFEWNPPEGQILRITPQTGQRLLDSLQAAGARRVN